jgi:TRAP-type C4-dicarboxylate transport system permease small subunit
MQESPTAGWFRRLISWYGSFLSWLLVISVAVLIIPVTMQIFARYTALIPPYIWTEEMARFLFIWMIMLGAMLGIREGSHFVVDVWPQLGPRPAAILDLIGGLAVLVMALVFVWWGWEFTRFAFYRISELAELPLWLIHIAWPLAGVTWLLFMGERMALDLRVLRGGGR